MNKWLEGWGDDVQAGVSDGEILVRQKPMIQQRVLTVDEIFNNGGEFREDLPPLMYNGESDDRAHRDDEIE